MKKIHVKKRFLGSEEGFKVIEFLVGTKHQIGNELFNSLKHTGVFEEIKENQPTVECLGAVDEGYEAKIINAKVHLKKVVKNLPDSLRKKKKKGK